MIKFINIINKCINKNFNKKFLNFIIFSSNTLILKAEKNELLDEVINDLISE